jgi:hypothetical protein
MAERLLAWIAIQPNWNFVSYRHLREARKTLEVGVRGIRSRK